MVFGLFSRRRPQTTPSHSDNDADDDDNRSSLKPPQTPSPPPPQGDIDIDADTTTSTAQDLYNLILSVPPKTFHSYTLSNLLPSSSSSYSPLSITHLWTFFADLTPPPRLHCVRCHSSYYDVENTDRSCLVPHDDDSAEVDRLTGGAGYETLYMCCERTVEGEGDMGPPDGWCYEGKHTTDTKRARFRADSTIRDDKLVSCERMKCPHVIAFQTRRPQLVHLGSSAKKRARRESDDADESEGDDHNDGDNDNDGDNNEAREGIVNASPPRDASSTLHSSPKPKPPKPKPKSRSTKRARRTPEPEPPVAHAQEDEESEDVMQVDSEPATKPSRTTRPRRPSTTTTAAKRSRSKSKTRPSAGTTNKSTSSPKHPPLPFSSSITTTTANASTTASTSRSPLRHLVDAVPAQPTTSGANTSPQLGKRQGTVMVVVHSPRPASLPQMGTAPTAHSKGKAKPKGKEVLAKPTKLLRAQEDSEVEAWKRGQGQGQRSKQKLLAKTWKSSEFVEDSEDEHWSTNIGGAGDGLDGGEDTEPGGDEQSDHGHDGDENDGGNNRFPAVVVTTRSRAAMIVKASPAGSGTDSVGFVRRKPKDLGEVVETSVDGEVALGMANSLSRSRF